MFETRIQNSKLAGSLADCMFRRISGCNYEGDFSFISTLRALLMNRNLGNDKITFKCFTHRISLTEDFDVNKLENSIEPNTISYVNISADVMEDEAQLKEKFYNIQAPSFLHEFMDVREFFAKKMACRAFICEESKSAMIVVLQSNTKKHHLAQCIMPKLLPWYFNGTTLSANERAMLYALCERTSVAYSAIIDTICDSPSFHRLSTSAAIIAFKKKNLENQKKDSERKIKDYESLIDKLNMDIVEKLRDLTGENMRLSGILVALESDIETDDELTRFIGQNRDITLLNMSDSELSIMIKSYLDVYDPDAYTSISKNPSAWYWMDSATRTGPFMVRENRKLVLDSIFGHNPVFKLKSYACYNLNVEYNEVRAGRHGMPSAPTDRYANPHLAYASCLGSYRSYINRALNKGDIIGAISQCITSAHSVNVTESATFRHLCRDLFTLNTEVLEGPDGNSYTPLAAYEYLKKQKEATNAK